MKRYLIIVGVLALLGVIAALVQSGLILKGLGTSSTERQYTSGIRGTVLLGPSCPVMRTPPDPGCADKPYATNISVYHQGSTDVVATTKSDVNGTFEFSLPPGVYTLHADGGAVLPRCASVDTVVDASGYVTTNIPCDSGIR